MSTSETKIELVTEAIEALVLATVVAKTGTDPTLRVAHHQNVVDARAAVADALKILLTPTLRIVSTETEQRVGEMSSTKRRVVTDFSAEKVPYGGRGVDGMNLA